MGEIVISLTALIMMEIILGIDNVIFIAILTGALPENMRSRTRAVGLSLALVLRILLLMTITWVMGLTRALFVVFEHAVSIRDIILLVGGLFLIAKSSHEIFNKMEIESRVHEIDVQRMSFISAVSQIIFLDLIFSLDSVMTAVGMVKELWMMIVAVVAAIIVMLVFSGPVAGFVERHPSVKILALSFLILIGVMLMADGLGQHINRGYIYFALFFSLSVELINMHVRKMARNAHT